MPQPYDIEIVPVDRGWILETMANAIASAARREPARFRVEVVNEPTDRADLTFFLPESAYRPLRNSITVTYLAHKEAHSGAAALFEEVARKSDYCITSSTKYQRILEADGARRVFKVHLGVDTNLFVPKLILGVVGRTYHTGRKGEQLLAEIAGMPMVELRFTGDGWPFPADHYSAKDLAAFYHGIDYLLIPSLIEGGPAPMLEALASGCPVVAPSDIGFVEDFPHIPFRRGDAKDLRRVVDSLLQDKLKLRSSVMEKDWSHYAKCHLELFANMIEERGATRARYGLRQSDSEATRNALLVTHGMEDSARGGPSTRVDLIARQLQSEGHRVDVRHNISRKSDLNDYDLIHIFNSWPPESALNAMAIAKQAGKRVIFSPIVLDLWHWPIYRQLLEHVFNSGQMSAVQTILKQLPALIRPKCYAGKNADRPVEGIPGHFEGLRRACALADVVIFLSHKERELLEAIDANIKVGELIRNGISEAFSSDVDGSLFKNNYGLEKYVLCVGRVEYRKNQALLAFAMRDMEVPLVLIGDIGDTGYLDHVRRLGGNNLYHFSRIDDKQLLASAYAGASAFALPSWCEGAPLAALEAGSMGVPLVLSNMSSEEEYFGEYASYVNPADINEIHDAIERVLARAETGEQRARRRSYIRERYNQAEHARQTLRAYSKAVDAEREGNDEVGLVIDVSALLHSLRAGSHLTGVPLAEKNIVAELVQLRPDARCVVYNDLKNRFVEVPYKELETYDDVSFNSRYLFSDSAKDGDVDLRLELTLSGISPPPQIGQGVSKAGRVRHLAARGKSLLIRMGLNRAALDHVWNLLRIAHQKLHRRSALTVIADAKTLPDTFAYEDIAKYFSYIPAPRCGLDIPFGSRVLTLGQSWLSNEPLLDSLLVLTAGHQLEPYVYDISYISGAHFSGWSDNADRQRRLDKLLSHSSTIFTESRTTAAEIAKYGATRGMCFRVIRTQLRGKSIEIRRGINALHTRHPFVLFVSSFNTRKNHDFIVNVWSDLIKASSAVAGSGVKMLFLGEVQGESKYADSKYLESLRRMNIEVIHDTDDKKLAQLYSDCLFTIYPSLQEGWGIPVQESLMYGKVCLVSSTVPAAEEIENAALIKLSPNDYFAWREAIQTWMLNDAMRLAFEEQARRYAPPTWRSIAEKILAREVQ